MTPHTPELTPDKLAAHLRSLILEREAAMHNGLGDDLRYMADLADELDEIRRMHTTAVVAAIARLREALGDRVLG